MFKNFKKDFEKILLVSFLFIIGVSVFLSLITFNKTDNNFFSYNSSLTENKNLLGFVGSFVSSFLKDIFGNISFLIPLFFIFHSIRSIFGKNLFWYNWSLLPILLIFSCILVELVSSNYFQNFFFWGYFRHWSLKLSFTLCRRFLESTCYPVNNFINHVSYIFFIFKLKNSR